MKLIYKEMIRDIKRYQNGMYNFSLKDLDALMVVVEDVLSTMPLVNMELIRKDLIITLFYSTPKRN